MFDAVSEKNGLVHLQGEATIHNILQVRERLLTISTQFPQMTSINLDNLNDIDTAGVQVLLSFKKNRPSTVFYCRNNKILELVNFLGFPDLLS